MSKLLGYISIPALVFASAFSFADAMTEEQAKQHIEEYRLLRKQCTVASFAKKQACFHELNLMTSAYKSAKTTLAANKGKPSVLIGYAQ
ncbi:MAG: hypothetical protein K6L76_06730 [Agarilytica sp.]